MSAERHGEAGRGLNRELEKTPIHHVYSVEERTVTTEMGETRWPRQKTRVVRREI